MEGWKTTRGQTQPHTHMATGAKSRALGNGDMVSAMSMAAHTIHAAREQQRSHTHPNRSASMPGPSPPQKKRKKTYRRQAPLGPLAARRHPPRTVDGAKAAAAIPAVVVTAAALTRARCAGRPAYRQSLHLVEETHQRGWQRHHQDKKKNRGAIEGSSSNNACQLAAHSPPHPEPLPPRNTDRNTRATTHSGQGAAVPRRPPPAASGGKGTKIRTAAAVDSVACDEGTPDRSDTQLLTGGPGVATAADVVDMSPTAGIGDRWAYPPPGWVVMQAIAPHNNKARGKQRRERSSAGLHTTGATAGRPHSSSGGAVDVRVSVKVPRRRGKRGGWRGDQRVVTRCCDEDRVGEHQIGGYAPRRQVPAVQRQRPWVTTGSLSQRGGRKWVTTTVCDRRLGGGLQYGDRPPSSPRVRASHVGSRQPRRTARGRPYRQRGCGTGR